MTNESGAKSRFCMRLGSKRQRLAKFYRTRMSIWQRVPAIGTKDIAIKFGEVGTTVSVLMARTVSLLLCYRSKMRWWS